jgi:hypothetical protein
VKASTASPASTSVKIVPNQNGANVWHVEEVPGGGGSEEPVGDQHPVGPLEGAFVLSRAMRSTEPMKAACAAAADTVRAALAG